MTKEYTFNPGDFVVYPTHGVGRVKDIVCDTIGGQNLSFLEVNFEKDQMTMKIPTTNKRLRSISSRSVMDEALSTLSGKAKVKKIMWSKRASEYEEKINSGDPCQVAQVVRDLFKPTEKSEQSYSERLIFEQAFERLSHEYATLENISIDESNSRLNKILETGKF